MRTVATLLAATLLVAPALASERVHPQEAEREAPPPPPPTPPPKKKPQRHQQLVRHDPPPPTVLPLGSVAVADPAADADPVELPVSTPEHGPDPKAPGATSPAPLGRSDFAPSRCPT
jgi:protein TonB